MTEAKVSIDGKELTGAQTMAIRIALDHFTSDLREKGLGLGRAWSRDDCGVLGAAGGSPKYDGRVVRYEERSPVKNIISFPVDAPDSSELRLGAGRSSGG